MTGGCADRSVIVNVKRALRYPGYDVSARPPVNDVAILVLESPVRFSRYIQPVCLPTSPIENEDIFGRETELMITGWGNTKSPSYYRSTFKAANVLQFLKVKAISQEECSQIWRKYSTSYSIFKHTNSYTCLQATDT